MRNTRLVERYVIRAVIPYTLASLVLLSAILFAQQTGRYFETIFHTAVPSSLVYGLALALLPTVLVFTIPMAVLSGTIIGFGRMASDSELVAIRAAGISTWKILWPALALGVIATGATLELNMREAARSAQHLRQVAVRSALYKLDSPVEPRTFTTDIPGYVIYVRDGDKSRGQWGRIFIQTQDAKRVTHVVTARSGRIDSSEEKSELVLQDAVETQIPPPDSRDQSYIVERIAQLRILFNSGRGDLLAAIRKPESNPDDMDWNELRRFAASSDAPNRREALLILHKRLAFALAPLVFAFFGATLALRLRRGSRGFGVLVSLIVLLIYYLVTIAGDQMARGGSLNPIIGAWLATTLTTFFAFVLLWLRPRQTTDWFRRSRAAESSVSPTVSRRSTRSIPQRRWAVSFPTLLDLGIVRTMTASFLFGFIALVLIFNVFTTFELWRFLATNRDRLRLLTQYLFYLLPLVSVEIFPGSVLVATLMTYALVARRREAVAWWASGQSVYRLMLPGLAFAILIAGGSWLIQERVMPQANVRQDSLRAKIRGGNVTTPTGTSDRRWLVSNDGQRIYSYEFDTQRQALVKPAVFEFDLSGVEVKRIINGEAGNWTKPNELEIVKPQWINLEEAHVSRQSAEQLTLDRVDPPSVFRPIVDRPSQLSSTRLRDYIKPLKERGADTATLAVALQRKYAGPFSVIVMALIGMPLAISFGRKSTVIALCSAVVVSLAFWLLSGGFQQLGEHALLPPAAAAWAPIAIFAGGALYFISRVRT